MSSEAPRRPFFSRIAPAFALMLLAPLLTEVLPGATRFSSIFVFPIEVTVWGGGALLIRAAVRHWRLGWVNMLFLALALSLAEECIIQQTSLAPMVLRLKGVEYARAFGVNYVYSLWALAYETIFVVFAPVYLAELIFPQRRENAWVGKIGVVIVALLFVLGSLLAWFSWTQYARPNVFHVPLYNPPQGYALAAFGAIATLAFLAIGPFRRALAKATSPLKPPPPWVLALAGCVWANAWYALAVLAFGAWPDFPPAAAVSLGLLAVALIVFVFPRWSSHPGWRVAHQYASVLGVITGSMMLSFVGFIGGSPADLYFKIATNLIALLLLIAMGFKLRGLTR